MVLDWSKMVLKRSKNTFREVQIILNWTKNFMDVQNVQKKEKKLSLIFFGPVQKHLDQSKTILDLSKIILGMSKIILDLQENQK